MVKYKNMNHIINLLMELESNTKGLQRLRKNINKKEIEIKAFIFEDGFSVNIIKKEDEKFAFMLLNRIEQKYLNKIFKIKEELKTLGVEVE